MDIPLTHREVAGTPNSYRESGVDRERDSRRAVVPAKQGKEAVGSHEFSWLP